MEQSKIEFSEKHRVTYYETNGQNKATLAMIINMAILASEDQNNALLASNKVRDDLNASWVVIQYSIDINKLPRTDENVVLKTRASSYNKFFASREFWINDLNGNSYVHISSNWVTMNLKTRKMVLIPKPLVEAYGFRHVDEIPHLKRPKRINDDADKFYQKDYHVRYNDIDMNGHVNNSHYLNWIVDSLPASFLSAYNPTHIDLRFKNEVRYGQNVESKVSIKNLNQTKAKTRHEIISNDYLAVVANCVWKKN
ncbi:acyl-ACP thioesterase [Philodulcilactobacillus myokoensis]|uniref:Acyl-ACP thioesterase n=1 Tax=Philodulcilactobacillus myokoensis TaxID=2929573 RepID=A0A9W6B1H0_9LACO|nr:acyl-ACP thioesterase domain-containing protein [Philodulcilactobacillus myokoensis]GLB47155.1 acyl-ACP thioesterase [Philodulcilactobacillus myokoensis]